MSKTKFTFKNYLKELRKQWIILLAFFVVGGVVGAYYSFSKPIVYTATAKISIYNPKLNVGSPTSPYSQIAEFLASDSLLIKANEDVEEKDIVEHKIVETSQGVFSITTTGVDEDLVVKNMNMIVDSTESIIELVYDDADDYTVTVLSRADCASSAASKKSRFISTSIAAICALALAMIIVFVRFDYKSE